MLKMLLVLCPKTLSNIIFSVINIIVEKGFLGVKVKKIKKVEELQHHVWGKTSKSLS
jgi:hypothetical protein